MTPSEPEGATPPGGPTSRWRRWLNPTGHPTFRPSRDPVLVSFATLFQASGLTEFVADKHLRADAFEPVYDCSTTRLREAGAQPEMFVAVWSPVWERDAPVTGFRTGRDSVWLGSTPTVAMPQDERTEALLLLVTSDFVHLSASRSADGTVVRGAVDTGEPDFAFVELAPAPAPLSGSARRGPDQSDPLAPVGLPALDDQHVTTPAAGGDPHA